MDTLCVVCAGIVGSVSIRSAIMGVVWLWIKSEGERDPSAGRLAQLFDTGDPTAATAVAGHESPLLTVKRGVTIQPPFVDPAAAQAITSPPARSGGSRTPLTLFYSTDPKRDDIIAHRHLHLDVDWLIASAMVEVLRERTQSPNIEWELNDCRTTTG